MLGGTDASAHLWLILVNYQLRTKDKNLPPSLAYLLQMPNFVGIISNFNRKRMMNRKLTSRFTPPPFI